MALCCWRQAATIWRFSPAWHEEAWDHLAGGRACDRGSFPQSPKCRRNCVAAKALRVYVGQIIGTRRLDETKPGADGRETVALPPAARRAPCPTNPNCSTRRDIAAPQPLVALSPTTPCRRRIARCWCACNGPGSIAHGIKNGLMGSPRPRRRGRMRSGCRAAPDRLLPCCGGHGRQRRTCRIDLRVRKRAKSGVCTPSTTSCRVGMARRTGPESSGFGGRSTHNHRH